MTVSIFKLLNDIQFSPENKSYLLDFSLPDIGLNYALLSITIVCTFSLLIQTLKCYLEIF